MPLAAPVITATVPSSRPAMFVCPFLCSWFAEAASRRDQPATRSTSTGMPVMCVMLLSGS